VAQQIRVSNIVAFGYNAYYQLSDGSPIPNYPAFLSSYDLNNTLYNTTVVAVASNNEVSMIALANGKLVTWGKNDYGQLGGLSYSIILTL
jgi:alpha-tubulin suppressor-like RCC1 family protein